jgi:excisionase family DNA binding protein
VISWRGAIYTVEEVSDLLGIPRPTLYRYLREYSIPHLRRSGRISIPEESFERIREARDLHKEGLGTGSVRRLLREGGGPRTGELKEQLDQLSENLESLRGNEKPAAEEALPSHALRTILARQNLLVSAMFNLTEMVEELLLASGKPRKAVFDDVEGEIRGVTPPPERTQLEIPKGVPAATESTLRALPARSATRFGSLARQRRRGVLAFLSTLLVAVLLVWVLPLLGSELPSGLPFFDGSEAESSPGAPEDEGAAQGPPAGSEEPDDPESGAAEAERVEVPDVSDRGVAEAVRILPRAGFRVSAIKVVKSQKEPGTVMRTKPSAGSAVEPGTPVVPVVSGGPTGIPPGIRSGDLGGGAAVRYAS